MRLEFIANAVSYSFVIPPTVFIVTGLTGAVMALRWKRTGYVIAFASLLCLYAFATPFVSERLLGILEQPLANDGRQDEHAGAIVVLGGDAHITSDPSGDKEELGLLSLERVYLAAREYRVTHLPILLSGGALGTGRKPLANLMGTVLEETFGVAPRWRDVQARSTYENAQYSAEILKQNGITSVVLITQRWHMPRAIWSFAQFGVHAVPADLPFDRIPTGAEINDFIPSIPALMRSFFAMHELIGIAYYRLAHGKASEVARISGPPAIWGTGEEPIPAFTDLDVEATESTHSWVGRSTG